MRCAAIGLGLALAATGNAASATVATATYRGTIESGFDQTGVFGTPAASLDGVSYIVRLRYDTALGTRTSSIDTDELVGGGVYGNASPIVQVSLTIAGVTRLFLRDFEGTAFTATPFGVQHGARGTSVGGGVTTSSELLVYGGAPGTPASLETPYPETIDTLGTFLTFSFSSHDVDSNALIEFASGLAQGNGIATYSVAVPEPASWAMMIAGFGLVGAAMRRTRWPVKVS